jgi:hypothetical protein
VDPVPDPLLLRKSIRNLKIQREHICGFPMATVFIQTRRNISCIKRAYFVFILRESSEGDEGSQFSTRHVGRRVYFRNIKV